MDRFPSLPPDTVSPGWLITRDPNEVREALSRVNQGVVPVRLLPVACHRASPDPRTFYRVGTEVSASEQLLPPGQVNVLLFARQQNCGGPENN